jgi:hypothetical protein
MGLVKVGLNKSYDLRKQKTVLFVCWIMEIVRDPRPY